MPERTPQAFEITYSPIFTGPQQPQPLVMGSAKFWGCPNLVHRLIYGVDFNILEAIERSGKWTGTRDELIALVIPHRLGPAWPWFCAILVNDSGYAGFIICAKLPGQGRSFRFRKSRNLQKRIA